MSLTRYSFLGIWVNALMLEELNDLIASTIAEGGQRVLANHNLHSVYLYHHDEDLRRFYATAENVHVDGMSLVVLGRLCGVPLKRVHRTTYVDWVGPLLERASQQKWRVFYLGSRPGVAERAGAHLRSQYPDLRLALRHGYFDARPGSEAGRATVEAINQFAPHILIVGMGMPRQEHWILEHRELVSCNVILPSGGAMDYVAGALRTPPRWMGRWSLEWLYRLCTEPRRLCRRYLVEPWYVLGLLAKEIGKRAFGTQLPADEQEDVES